MKVNRRLIIIVVGIVAAGLATIGTVAATQWAPQADPPWVGDHSTCRTTPTTHVHNPKRLEMLNPCATFRGRVQSVRLVSAYDDLKVTIVPDDNLRSYLRKANNGLLVADIIATDQATITVPPVGSRITAWGAWMLDKATKTTQLLPTYRIVINQLKSGSSTLSGHSVEKSGPPIKRLLQLAVKTSNRVVVGGRIDAPIQARWLEGHRLKPASQIRLFVEMTTADGTGVRWKATMTDTRGSAVIHLVAIQAPAAYTLTIYAAESGQPVSATARIQVTKA
ncbi:MAG: hypothetical protein QOF92_1787 [Pseudonocardiales bacterium]|jgi:hypothetical protein|nr:hypothetical protein [Pseudonocardiales bacterium]